MGSWTPARAGGQLPVARFLVTRKQHFGTSSFLKAYLLPVVMRCGGDLSANVGEHESVQDSPPPDMTLLQSVTRSFPFCKILLVTLRKVN